MTTMGQDGDEGEGWMNWIMPTYDDHKRCRQMTTMDDDEWNGGDE